MKNIKTLFVIAIVAAIIFAACGELDTTYPVYFSVDGQPYDSQDVVENYFASKPADPVKNFVPTDEGLFKGKLEFDYWADSSNDEFDFDTPIIGTTNLHAVWKEPVKITSLTATGNIVEKSISYINTNDTAGYSYYTLVLDSGYSVPAQILSATEAELLIIGRSIEKKITLSGTGKLFTVGKSTLIAGETISTKLTIGENITLVGSQTNNNSLVYVQNGATFIMLDGSKVTGNKSTATTGDTGQGSAVHIDSKAYFYMKGGSITGNEKTDNVQNSIGAAGVFVRNDSEIVLSGGSIKTNIGTITNDIYIEVDSTIEISGDTEIGELTIANSTDGNRNSFVSVSVTPGFTGSVEKVNLRAISNNADGVKTWWAGKVVLKPVSGSLTQAIVDKFPLGSYIHSGTVSSSKSAITGYKIKYNDGTFVSIN